MKVLILGGVAAGMSAASKLKRVLPQAEVVVYEKGGFLSYGACGLPYYVGNFNDDYRRMIARSREDFEALGIQTHIYHEAIGVDFEKKQVTIRDLEENRVFTDHYDQLMIATGAYAIQPPIPGIEKMGVHTLKTMEEGIFLREYAKSDAIRQVVIIGGGYIGVECAEAFLHLGKQVRILEAAPRILTTFDPEIAILADEELRKQGVLIHLNEEVKAFHGEHTVSQVETTQGCYDADLVIVAVGIRPATDFLADTGIRMAKNGALLVDREMRTSIPDVYAAGDCILCYHEGMQEDCFLALGTVANKCGRIAGANLAGAHQKFMGALGTAALKVCELEFGRTGMSEADAKRLGIRYRTIMVKSNDHPAYYPGQTPITIRLIYEAGTKRLLGAQTCGEKGAVLRADVFAVAIHAKMSTEELGMLDLAYAPPFAGVWDAIHIACNAAKD